MFGDSAVVLHPRPPGRSSVVASRDRSRAKGAGSADYASEVDLSAEQTEPTFRVDRADRPARSTAAVAAPLRGRGPVSVDEFLCADDDGQREPVGVVGVRFGRVDRDANVVAGVDEGVAVEGEVPYSRVVDGLVP
jgi:hypothetical protein